VNIVLTDSHVHLASYQDPVEELERAKRLGMRLISVSVSVAEASQNLVLRGREPTTVRSFVGVHPSETAAFSAPVDLDALEPVWDTADGVGEIGLDPKYSEISAGSAQMDIFRRQLDKADRLKRPVQVHSRSAEEACLDVLETYSLRAVLLHWFQGEGSLERAISLSHSFFSFGPALLYSKRLARIAKRCPQDLVLTESDGPVPFSPLGGVSGPSLIPSVAFKLSEIWGKSYDETTLQLDLSLGKYLG
jgi:TatD DNase family protein